MTFFRIHFVVGMVGVLVLAFIMVTGSTPSTKLTEEAPVSVRDNPTSYRAAYVGYAGYTARPTTGSGGGYRVGK